MSASLYEIVELPNGDVALRRADDEEGEPLVYVRFSAESLYFLKDKSFDIAKAMIEAGMETASDLFAAEQEVDSSQAQRGAFGVPSADSNGDGQEDDLGEVFFELDDTARTIH